MSTRIILFILVSLILAYFSRAALLHPKAHGFSRFFAWECILIVVLINQPYWFLDPFSLQHIFSWLLLVCSIYLALYGYILLKSRGKHDPTRLDDHLYSFEKTAHLVTTGVYRYIRHPLYASLLFLDWGAFLKNISLASCVFAGLATVLLYMTARQDEDECLRYFGKEYQVYMSESHMFVPYLF